MVNWLTNTSQYFSAATTTCFHSFLGLVPWYQYLPIGPAPTCSITLDLSQTNQWDKLWLIGFAIFEDLLRVAGMLAVVFIIYGGIRYITSQGEPETKKSARGTIINALIGLAIAIIAATTVQFIANNIVG